MLDRVILDVPTLLLISIFSLFAFYLARLNSELEINFDLHLMTLES